MGRRSPHARSRMSTLGACSAVDSPTPFARVSSRFRPHDRAVDSTFGLKRNIEERLLGNEFILSDVFITGLCIGYHLDAPHI